MNAPERPAAGPAPTLIGCGETPGLAAPPSPEAIGFKAHNLARMAALGLPVPPAFVLGTAWCAHPAGVRRALWQPALAALERASGLRFGDARRPLLLSVRSGAPVSMPGMMETLLNIGLSDATLPGLLRTTGNPRLAWDAYRRLVAGFGEVVLGMDGAVFEEDLRQACLGRDERELDFIELRALTCAHQASLQRVAGRPFPQDPLEQLDMAIRAVFASWQAPKARDYRHMNKLDDALGTAVTVQRMVFGNAGGSSGAGVGFTRHPSTGEPQPWVDFLFNAQGEDVVSGRRSAQGHDELASVAPRVWAELLAATHQLEQTFADMQDFEFTVENDVLWMLQTRNGKRTAQAKARIALDLFDEAVIDQAEALKRTAGLDESTLSLARVVASDGERLVPLAQAVSAAHGVAVGEIALDEARAQARQAAGVAVLLVRQDAETRDIVALEIAAGLLTARGARTSHAAVVARQLGKVCLVGCESLHIDAEQHRVRFGAVQMAEGEVLTLDGHTGAIYRGAARTVSEAPAELLSRLAALRAGAAAAARPGLNEGA
jgi:pyruvate,orthophosphate dikinase